MQGRASVDVRRSLAAGDNSGVDAQLRHAVEREVRAGQSRAVLALHLSRLQQPAPRPHHRRIAKAVLDDAAQSHAGQVFARGNTDVILICDPAGAGRVRDTLARLFKVDAPVTDQLLSLWDLPQDATAIATYLSRNSVSEAVPNETSVAPNEIGAMEAIVGAGRLTDLVRRQTAVQVINGALMPLYRELTFSIETLDTRVHAAGSADSDPYLFRHLAGRLDLKMLTLLSQELVRPSTLSATPALHINLTTRAVLSPGFLRLADAAAAASVRIGIEIALMDACADPLAFGAARMVLRAHGCAVVLDGLSHQALLLTRLEALDADLVKLEWSPRMADLGLDDQRLLDQAIQRIGANRLVLHRAEAQAALAWGHERAISRFQGRQVDSVLAAGRIAACPHAAGCTLRQCNERAAATGAAGRSGCRDTVRLDSVDVTPAIAA